MPDLEWTTPDGMQALTTTSQVVISAADLTCVEEVDSGATGTRTAVSSLSAAPTGYLALSLVITSASDQPPSPDPSPDADPGGATDYAWARIDSSPWFAITAVDPTSGAGYPGYRGPNELILYTDSYGSTTDTNMWGTEVPYDSGDMLINSVNDRQANQDPTGTSIPSPGGVLSGHGAARDWLNTWATVGGTITLAVTTDPNPTPGGGGGGGTTPTGGYPVRSVDCYKKIWSSNSAITNIPSTATAIRLSFAQGSPPALVGYTTDGQSTFVSALATRRTAGQKIIASIGGAGGQINTGDRSGFVSGIASIVSILEGSAGGGLDGIDWDIEASSLVKSDVVWISQQLKSVYGSDFAITMAPNGGNVSTYLPAAVALHNAGVLDHYAQQFYDSPVSLAAAKQRIQQALSAGLPQSVMGVGMMTTSNGNGDSTHWSLAQCRTYMADIRSTWPGITKCYIWTEDGHLSSGAISTWVSDMRQIVGL